jgi:hypothetical protein
VHVELMTFPYLLLVSVFIAPAIARDHAVEEINRNALAAQDCPGEAYLRVSLSGSLNRSIDWEGPGTACGGYAGGDEISLSFSRNLMGADSILDVTVRIFEIRPGRVGGGHPAEVILGGPALEGRHYVTHGQGCTARITESEAVGEAGDVYRVTGSAWCTEPALNNLGDEQIRLGALEFSGPVRVALGGG